MSFNSLICRLCLLESNTNLSIFTISYDEVGHGYLPHKIMQIANVQVYENDGLPGLICRACLCRVEGFFQFKVQVEKSDFFLRQQVCTYQGEGLQTTCEGKTHNEEVKTEPLPMLKVKVVKVKKNGVYITENIWTDSVQSFTSISNCESLTETVTISTPQEVTDVLAEDPTPTFIHLGNQNSGEEDKSLLDLTQHDGKSLGQSSDSLTNFHKSTVNHSIIEEPVVREIEETNDNDKSVSDNQYASIIFNDRDALNLDNSKNDEIDKVKNFYNLDKGKEFTSIENPSTQLLAQENNTFNNITHDNECNEGDIEFENENNEYNSTINEEVIKKSDDSGLKISYCEECDKHFDKPVLLKKHQALHMKESYKCSFCSKVFKQSLCLQSHIRTHTGERPFVCNICSKSFTEKSALSSHVRVAHFTERTHGCKFCGKAFKLKKQLDRHERIHTGHQYHRCEICGNLFTQKSNLMKHLVLHSGEKPYPCPVCQKQFAQKDNLNIHIMRHHSQQNPVVCDVCGKMFKNKMTLMGHKKNKHDNTKEIICEVCGKFFPDRSCLNSHKWVHSSGGPIQCDLCGKTYPHARAMRVHKRTVHSEVRKYCCDVCGIGFKTSQTLKHHKVVHTGERAFSCDECGRSFGQKTALKTHQRIHSGVEPYSCPRCGESFKWKQTCDKHVVKCAEKPRRDFIIPENPVVP